MFEDNKSCCIGLLNFVTLLDWSHVIAVCKTYLNAMIKHDLVSNQVRRLSHNIYVISHFHKTADDRFELFRNRIHSNDNRTI